MSDCYISRSKRIAARKLGEEMIVMSADDSSLYILNEVATAIWEAADGQTALGSIVEQVVCAHFDADLSAAQQDAAEFVEALARHKILLVSERPIGGEEVSTRDLPLQPQEAPWES